MSQNADVNYYDTVESQPKLLKPDVIWFLPFLAKMFPNLEGSVEGLKGEPGDVRHFLTETIQHHKDTLDPDNIRDFIDAYLIEMKVMMNMGGCLIICQTKINCKIRSRSK